MMLGLPLCGFLVLGATAAGGPPADLLSPAQYADARLTDQDVTIYGAQAGDELGQARQALAIGDFNRDGAGDLAIGGPGGSGLGGSRPGAGEIAILFGPFERGQFLDLAQRPPDVRVLGPGEGLALGTMLAAADLSGDGADDLAIGLPAGPLGAPTAGTVLVLFGPFAAGQVIDLASDAADVTITGAAPGDQAGYSITTGDVSGDQIPDLVLGAPGSHNPATPATVTGAVYALFAPLTAGTTLDLASGSADATVYADEALGGAVEVGDLNGDGNGDLAMGAPLRANAQGGAYVVFGPLSRGSVVDLALQPADIVYALAAPNPSIAGGAALLCADVTGDGAADFTISSPGPSAAGLVEVFRGPLTSGTLLDGTSFAEVILLSSEVNFGLSLRAGDMSGDGDLDLAIGSPLAITRGRLEGGMPLLFYSPMSYPDVMVHSYEFADLALYGAERLDHLGASIALGDLGGDAAADLAVAAALADGPRNARDGSGEVYVFFGGQGLACLPRPARTTALKAARRNDDVLLSWDQASDPATAAYDVWALSSGDKSTLPYVNRALAGPDVASPCQPPPPTAMPACTDPGAVRRAPSLLFYQVRAACADGTENTDQPF